MSHHKRVGNWMQTFSGRQFWPMDPKPEDVCILDIANSLGKICRYNGHCKKFYSVAEHSYYVSKYVEPQNALWGLLHDASEAYMCDLIRPLKNEPFARSFRLFENKIIEVIADRLSEEVEGGMVDNGIGDYEYWGARGVDHNWQFELREEEIEIEVRKDEALPVEFTFNKDFDDGDYEIKASLNKIRKTKDKIFASYYVELV